MLDYTIWEYLRNDKKIKGMEKEYDDYDLEENQIYHNLLKRHTQLIDKMKGWRVKIFNLKPIVFDNTDLVENKELFIIDYEGWNRDHPKRKQGLNNDDLEIVSR